MIRLLPRDGKPPLVEQPAIAPGDSRIVKLLIREGGAEVTGDAASLPAEEVEALTLPFG